LPQLPLELVSGGRCRQGCGALQGRGAGDRVRHALRDLEGSVSDGDRKARQTHRLAARSWDKWDNEVARLEAANRRALSLGVIESSSSGERPKVQLPTSARDELCYFVAPM